MIEREVGGVEHRVFLASSAVRCLIRLLLVCRSGCRPPHFFSPRALPRYGAQGAVRALSRRIFPGPPELAQPLRMRRRIFMPLGCNASPSPNSFPVPAPGKIALGQRPPLVEEERSPRMGWEK